MPGGPIRKNTVNLRIWANIFIMKITIFTPAESLCHPGIIAAYADRILSPKSA
jgi:hypothetical protein